MSARPTRPAQRHLVAAGAAVALLLGLLTGLLWLPAPAPAAHRSAPGQDHTPDRALAVLHRWDRARAAAYAARSADRLRDLYADGSAARRADVRTLRAYAARGLSRVRLHTQVFAARVLLDRPRVVAIRVVERSFGSAVGQRRCLSLPTSAPVSRQVVLRRTDGAWRVSTVWR